MAAQQNQYPYTRLSSCPPQIRVLNLYPSTNPDTPIQCSLRVVNFDSKLQPVYETVSYMWGNPDDRAEISVDGKKFYVTVNCVAALKSIRHTAYQKTLWVDAICINQGDDVEKGHQVGMMAQIYENGRVDFLYMGLKEEKSRLMISIFDKWKLLYDKGSRTSLRDIVGADGKKLDEKGWQGIMNTFEAGVWQRMWIVQELALAQDVIVICGLRRYRWTCLNALAEALLSPVYSNQITDEARKGINTIQSATILMAERRNMAAGLPGRDDLLSVWADFGYCGCYDPRDKIFALLGIVHGSKNLGIQPSYQITEQELFCDVTRRYIYWHQDLTIFLYCQSNDNIKGRSASFCKEQPSNGKGVAIIPSPNSTNNGPLPSWVPNFGSTSRCFVPGFLAYRSPLSEGHRSSVTKGPEIPWQKESAALLQQDRDQRTLSMIVIPYDRVSFVLNGTKSLQSDERLEYFKAAYLQLGKKFPSEYLNGQSFAELFWRTLASNQYRTSKDDFVTNILREKSDAFANWTQGLHYMLMNGFKKSKLDPSSHSGRLAGMGSRSKPIAAQIEASLIREQILDATPGYTMAFTERGHCALVPEMSCSGDLVCGLAGGSSPFILRPREMARERTIASLVGPAYVHQHKIREEWKRGRVNLTTFVLI